MKQWLQKHFLPMWAKETVLRDNRLLERENEDLRQKVHELEAYIAGLQAGLRTLKRIRTISKGGEA